MRKPNGTLGVSSVVAGPVKALRSQVNGRLRRTLPPWAYETVVGGYNSARVIAGRGPGRGRLLPDFLIIGAVKGGTTSLYTWLSDHPFVTPAASKQIHYFDYRYWRGLDWYRSHFPHEIERQAFTQQHGRPFITGEASPSYLSHPWAPERVAALLPQVKLIVAFRDPVDRAYSHFQMSRRAEEEPLESFEQAIAIEDERLEPERARVLSDRRYNSLPYGSWSYLTRGRYAEQLERWLELFPRDQFHFLTLEELSAHPSETLDATHQFLGLPPHHPKDLPRLNVGQYDPIARETRDRLREYFAPHNRRLYELVGRDFGWDRAQPNQSQNQR